MSCKNEKLTTLKGSSSLCYDGVLSIYKKAFQQQREKSSSTMTRMAFVVIGGEGSPYSRDICKNVCLEQMPPSNIARNLDL